MKRVLTQSSSQSFPLSRCPGVAKPPKQSEDRASEVGEEGCPSVTCHLSGPPLAHPAAVRFGSPRSLKRARLSIPQGHWRKSPECCLDRVTWIPDRLPWHLACVLERPRNRENPPQASLAPRGVSAMVHGNTAGGVGGRRGPHGAGTATCVMRKCSHAEARTAF